MAKFKRLMSIVLTIAMLCTTLLSTGMIAHASMLPLEEVKAYLVLNGKTDEEIANLNLDEMLGMLVDSNGNSIDVSSSATTVWRYVKSDEDGLEEYRQYTIGQNETIDLSIESGVKAYTVELIIGSANQLDDSNIRYIVKVYVTNTIQEEIGYELYLQDSNGNRSEVIPTRKVTNVNTQLFEITANEWSVSAPETGSQYYLNISSLADEHPNVKTEVYPFWEYCFMGTSATPITSTVLHQNMQNSNSGLAIEYGSSNAAMLALVYFDKSEQIIGQSFVSFAAVEDSSYIEAELYQKSNSEYTDIVMFDVDHIGFDDIDSIFAGAGVHELCLMLKDGYSVDSDVYCVLNAHGSTYGDDANSYVLKAAEGHYDTLDAAVECEDIKEQLIPTDRTSSTRGYKADYNYKNGGVPFTIFFEDGSVWKVLVLAMEYNPKYDEGYVRSFTEDPIIGEADPWFRVTGATDSNGKEYDAYVIENGKNINMDTYYGYGYQTVFINDANADLTNLEPSFWYVNTKRVYAVSKDTGNKVEDGHTRNFKDENQQYTGVIIDKEGNENERNYWVTFKQLNNSGAELFVYGPNEREVILDEYFEFKHDILVANIGNAPLEDISVELRDAENVKLDPYWTIGGDGNDTLAAFTTTEKVTQYGELANIAKIRLLPDGDGEVKGTLIIRAKGQEPVMITLNGTAQNPEIITEELDDAVKYVPYQHIIATNNMHDWVETKFSVSEGDLPAGITLNSETGEIYGVPTVPDGDTETTYTFTVEAKYLVEGEEGYFDASYKEFELVVKPNTDENVYKASDENAESTDPNKGYTIKQHIGTQVSDYRFELDPSEEAVYISYGQYDEFVKLWLNGVLLEEDTDYTSEEGSTKITISSQTMENNTNPDGANTIAMEFRKDNNGDGKGDSGTEMNRTSQNYYVKQKTNAEKVIDKIALLPAAADINNSNLNSVRSNVQSARSAYDKLSSDEKNKVTNRQKLFDAEQKITDLNEANNVIAKINSIPANITTDAKDEIQAARNAYKALTEAQKKLVTNIDRLEKAEQALSKYETDIAAAQKVDNLIKNLPSPLKLEDEDKVNNARTAYSNLTADQKKYVTKEETLRAAENEIVRLKAEAQEQAKINAVITAIDAIPENLTLNDKSIVESARIAYNALTDAQKEKVVNIDDLIKAEETIKALEAQENANKADKAVAQEVIDLIDALPEEVALTDKSAIEAARNAYASLTDKQQELVTNYGDLTDAEAAIKALEDYEAANKKDQAAADEVINLINAIPSDITLDDKATVETARSAYDALTDNQQKSVTNYNTLTDAEVEIAKLENDNYEEVQSITLVGILVDKDGKALVDKVVEIHSVIQNGRTDENGSFQFNNVEFGKHTIFVKDENGNIIAQREFNIVLGTPLSLNGNEIVAENGSVFTLRMQLDGDELTFVNVEEGNKAPVVDTDKNAGVDIGEGDKTDTIPDTDANTGNDQGNVSSPQTGDNSNLALWYTLLFASLGGLILTTYSGLRKRKYVGKYQR